MNIAGFDAFGGAFAQSLKVAALQFLLHIAHSFFFLDQLAGGIHAAGHQHIQRQLHV